MNTTLCAVLFQNARIHHLIAILTAADLLAAADYLHNDLLHIGPAPRNADHNCGSISGDISSEQPPGDGNAGLGAKEQPAEGTDCCKPTSKDNLSSQLDSCSDCSHILSWISGQVSEDAQSGSPASLLHTQCAQSQESDLISLIGMYA